MQENGKSTTPDVLTALGLPPIVVWYPCSWCFHKHEEHGQAGCTVEEKDERCDCGAYQGGLPDGSPRALRLRQLANIEWSSISPERSLPILLGAVDFKTIKQEEQIKHLEWMRNTVAMAVTHCRGWDDEQRKPVWRPLKVLPSGQRPDHDKWEISVDELDRGGTRLLATALGALVTDFNDGGPFGGVVRRFRLKRSPAVPPASDDIRADAARVGAEPIRRAG